MPTCLTHMSPSATHLTQSLISRRVLMRPLRAATLAVAALLMATPVADAQKKPKEPKRPKMDAGRDTNAAGAYYYWGIKELVTDPRSAEDAFYWASRLEPSWA